MTQFYVKRWMETRAKEFETSTELAEGAAGEFDLYEDRSLYKIPDWVFDSAEDVLPTT